MKPTEMKLKLTFFTCAIAALPVLCAYAKTCFTVSADRPDCRYDVGLSDVTCPPAGGWCAFNALGSKDKSMISVPGMTHSANAALEHDLLEWVCGTEPACDTISASPPPSSDS